MKSEVLLRARGLTKTYPGPDREVAVFRDLDLDLARGEMTAVIGASGAGKSTLLHLLGGLERPSAGSIMFGEFDIVKNAEIDLSRFRNRHVGFVFQFHHLLPEFSATENVMMPLLVGGSQKREARSRALELLSRAGLSARADHRPGELSGGERQRVAVARALVAGPDLLLADEPTGNLDERTGLEIHDLIRQLQREEHLTALIVTHNDRLAARCDRILKMQNGNMENGRMENGRLDSVPEYQFSTF
jgi:lipoprotein-releasing system ATP-binding protein